MKLVILYGPPASGKLTIAKELAHRIHFALFHNHVTVPVAKTLFPEGHESPHSAIYSNLLKKIRLDAIEAATEANIDVIFTFAYSGYIDDMFIDEIVKKVTNSGGHVYFVEVTASAQVLEQRVGNVSRHNMGKIVDVEHLRHTMATHHVFSTLHYPDILQIDSEAMNPQQAAQLIVEHFNFVDT